MSYHLDIHYVVGLLKCVYCSIAPQTPRLECLEFMIENGMDVKQKILLPHMGVKNTTFSSPLFRALEYSNENAIKTLLDYGADINQTITLSDNAIVYTPLSYALMMRPHLVAVLLEYGASS